MTNGLLMNGWFIWNSEKLNIIYFDRSDHHDKTTAMSCIVYQTFDQKIHKIDYADDVIGLDLRCRKIQRIIKIIGFTDLQELNLSNSEITRIKGLDNLTALQHLNLRGNHITRIEGLEQLTALQHLNLYGNQITHIRGLEQLTALQHLILSENQITRIEGLESLTHLKYLHLFRNQITHIEGLENLTAFQHLNLRGNQITRIEGLNNLTALRFLFLSENRITRIEGLDNLTALQRLYLSETPIKEVPITIMLLRSLLYLYIGIELDPIIRRFLLGNHIKSNRTVYDDQQNVHDSQINRSITQSLYRLMEQKSELSDETIINDILGDQILTKQIKEQLIEYIRITDVHSLLNVTFSEAFGVV